MIMLPFILAAVVSILFIDNVIQKKKPPPPEKQLGDALTRYLKSKK